MIGKALFSSTLLALSAYIYAANATPVNMMKWTANIYDAGPVSQVIDLGPAPTKQDYVPVMLVIRDVKQNIDLKDNFILSMGYDANHPSNMWHTNLGGYSQQASYMLPIEDTQSILPAGDHLYVSYSSNNNIPGTALEIDVLAYPTN